MRLRHFLAVPVLVAATTILSACAVEEAATDAAGGGSAAAGEKADNYTLAQKNAVQAAENYLDTGMGFSRHGLIQQLTSEAGSGFKRADAVFAVKQVAPNWKKQAVMAAQNYQDTGMGFSRDGMIQQLTSKAGSGFTREQAEFAVDKLGL